MKKHWFSLALLLIVALFLVFFEAQKIPKNLTFDEIEFGQLALTLDKTSYTPYSPIAFGHSTLYFYVILFSFKIFGVSTFALRLPAYIFGILSVLMYYLVMNLIFKDEKKILSSLFFVLPSFLLITSHWYLNFARFAFEATFLLFLELTSIYFLLKFLKDRKEPSLFLCALFAGLSFHSYTAGRIFFLLPLGFLLFKAKRRNIFSYLVIFFITVSPLLLYFANNPDLRFEELFFISKPTLAFSTKLGMFWENIKKTALMFNFQGDMNGRHNFPGKPALNPILGVLFVWGFILALKNFSSFANKFMVSYFLLAFIPALLTIPKDNPSMLRTFTVLPSVFYFVSISVASLIQRAKKYKRLSVFMVLFFLIGSSLYEMRTYFIYQSRVFRNAFEIKCPLDKVIKFKIKEIPKKCRVQKNEF
ncbi:glycosyltransferase family 39 protein [Candidatus Roizmanbacteria bacterium]|nr:glycosyltransferase family 39 protein [Candidatus Roizmanbacteria bacterium]